jgi:hypothetical protein
MMRRMKTFINLVKFFAITFLGINSSHALLNFEDHAFPELVTSGRALALGNAFICKTDDPWAVFYNPAGLGTVRKFSFHPGNFHFEVNKGFFNVTEGNSEDVPGKIADNFKADELKQNLIDHPDNIVHSRINLFPNLTSRYFSMGYLYSRRSRAALQDLNSDMEMSIRQDHGPLAAANISLFGGVLKFGISAVYLYRNELQREYDISQTIKITSEDYNKGNMLLATAGSRLTLPVTFLPTFAFVVRNTGNQKFHKRDDDHDVPNKIKQTMDAGFSITPQIGQRMRIHLEANLRDVHNLYETDTKRRLGAGIEFDYARTFFLRIGTGDGFGSGGIGINTRKFNIDLTTYAVDKTESDFRGEEDRRYVLSFSTGI